nr:unnamed protein product [Spirometra erinaceieuropaei]
MTAACKKTDDQTIHLILGGCSPIVNAHCTRTYTLERGKIIPELERNSFQYLQKAIENSKKMIAKKLNSVTYQKINMEAILEDSEVPLTSGLVVFRAEIVNLTDAENVTFGSVSHADTYLLTVVTLNGENIRTKLTSLTREVLPFGHWGPEVIEPLHWSRLLSRKGSVPDRELPVALVFHGVGQNSLIPAVCKFDCGKIHLYGNRLGSYDYVVKQVDHFSTDSADFWSLWQCYIDEASTTCESLGSGYSNPHAFFEFSSEESLNLYQNLGICHRSQLSEFGTKLGKTRSVFFIIYRGSTSHECLLALKGNSNVGVSERTEVAHIGNMHYQLESILSNRIDKESSAAFPFLDSAIMTLKNRNTSLSALKDVLDSSQKHLEASVCLSMCGNLNIRPGELLRRCGIYPMTLPTDDKEDLNFLIEKLGLSKEMTSEPPDSEKLASSDYIAQSRLQRFGLGDTPEADILSVTIICGLHGSHMTEVSSNILRLSQNENRWVVICPKSLTDIRADLKSSIKESIRLREEDTADHRRLRCLLVAPEFVSPIEVLHEIAEVYTDLPRPGGAEGGVSPRIASVLSCVDPRMCLMGDEGFILPGLGAFFELGWSNVILLTSPNSKSVGMLTEWLKDWLRSAAPQKSLPKEMLSIESLSPAMLDEIHEIYHLYPMPPGWYYTGSQYVHINGEKSFKHPCFQQFLKEHIEKENARIAKFNEDLANNPIPDLFA